MAVARDLQRQAEQRHRRDRRRRDVGRHGLRGHEQCRRDEFAPDRRAQRQRHVDRASGRRALGLSRAPRLRPRLSSAAQGLPSDRQAHADRKCSSSAQWRWRNMRAASSPAARCSTNSASSMSARSTATTSIICCRCWKTCATPRTGRSSFTSSRRRAKATSRRKNPPTNITASSSSTSPPARSRSRSRPRPPIRRFSAKA